MPAQSEYIQTVAGVVVQVQANVYVQLTNNDTAVAYVSAAASDSAGKVSFTPAPPSGVYTVATGPSNVGPWTGSGNSSYVVPEPSSSQTIAYAASIAIDASAGRDVSIGTLTGNLTLANPTNAAKGRTLSIKLTQDATGGRTVSWGNAFNIGLWLVNPTASATSTITVKYDGAAWQPVTNAGYLSGLQVSGNAKFAGPDPWYDVTHPSFSGGADPTGVADSTAAIAAAGVLAKAAHGGVILLIGAFLFTALNFDDSSNVILAGGGGMSGGASTASQITCTANGAGTAISARSTTGFQARDLQVICSGATFTGTTLDLSHSGTALDSGFGSVERVRFAASGGANPALHLNLDRVVNCSVISSSFANCAVAIRGASGAGSYSNSVSIERVQFNDGSTGTISTACIQNPGQAWTIGSRTTFEGATGAGTLTGIDCGYNGFAGSNGLRISGIWAGDCGANVTWFKLKGSGITVEGSYIAGAATTTAIFNQGCRGLRIVGNDFVTHSIMLDANSLSINWLTAQGNDFSAVTTYIANYVGNPTNVIDDVNAHGIGIGTIPSGTVVDIADTTQPAAVAGAGTVAYNVLRVVGGKGGNTTGTTGQQGGGGAPVLLTAGAGGNAPSGSTNGTGGNVDITPGAAGSGAGTAGTAGSMRVLGAFQMGSSGSRFTRWQKLGAVSITPASVAATASAEQTFTVTGVATGDLLMCIYDRDWGNAPAVFFRVSAADTIAIRFVNATAGAVTPAAGNITVCFLR